MQEQKHSGRIWRRWWLNNLHTSIDTSNFWRFNPNEENESIVHGLIFVNFWRYHPWTFLINVYILMGVLQRSNVTFSVFFLARTFPEFWYQAWHVSWPTFWKYLYGRFTCISFRLVEASIICSTNLLHAF